MCNDNNWYIKKREYSHALDIMNDEVNRMHQHSKAYYFTDHSITHSDRITEDLINLFPFLFISSKNEKALNDVEKFILFSSIVLHDIGIQLINPEILDYIANKYNISGNYDDKSKLDFIRVNHHLLSKYWIKENIIGEVLPIVYFGDKVIAKYIAIVVESHGIDFEKRSECIETTAYGNERIRMGLLCTLLSLGDALDCNQRRIDYKLLKISDLSTESRMHWMKHYYVDGIVLTPNLIEIFYSFPDVKDIYLREIYENYFVNKTKYWIEKCFTVRGRFLFQVGAICRVVDTIKFSDDKDELTNEELLKVENNYINDLQKEAVKNHIKYLQYIIPIIINTKNEILYTNNAKRLICENQALAQKQLQEYWSIFFESDESDWRNIGSTKSYTDNAIHHYYIYKYNSEKNLLKAKSNIDFTWMSLEEYLNVETDKYIHRLWG